MTQKELVLSYLQSNQYIIPAKMSGKPYADGFFGSETSRVCRRLRKEGILHSDRQGKFERFYMAKPPEYRMMRVENSDIYVKVIEK